MQHDHTLSDRDAQPGSRGRIWRRPLVLAVSALAGLIWCGAALAECTLADYRTCMQTDPAALERRLLREVAERPSPEMLSRLGEFYSSAPLAFRNATKARWYLERAANAGHAGARNLLGSKGNAAGLPGVEPDEPRRLADPPSTLAGNRISLETLIRVAYAAGFRTEAQLLPAVGIALAESGLWTTARNWKPSRGFRPKTDRIGVKGPPSVWSADGRQAHSDRGLWQIATWAWPEFPDSVTDDPTRAARAAYKLSDGGRSFSIWDTFTSGRAQRHYDRPKDGWPALRPLIKQFLSRTAAGPGAEATMADAR